MNRDPRDVNDVFSREPEYSATVLEMPPPFFVVPRGAAVLEMERCRFAAHPDGSSTWHLSLKCTPRTDAPSS